MVVPLLWGLLAVLGLALSWATGAGAFAWVGGLMLAVLVAGILAARLAQRGLRATRWISADRIALGAAVEVEVEVANRSRLPAVWVLAAETLPAGLPMTGVRGRVGWLAGRASFHFRYSLIGARRGYYHVGPTILRTGDLFGLSLRERAAEGPAGLIVFPRVVAIRHARLPSLRAGSDVRARHRVLEDPIQVIGIRPYQRGDGLRRVHWRASAHTGEWQSKLIQPAAQIETAVALNLRRADYPAAPGEAADLAELAIVAAASVSHHVLERRQRTGLLVVGRDMAAQQAGGLVRLAPGRGRDQLTAVLSTLGRMALGAVEPLAGVLTRERKALTWGSLVVVITPTVADELVRALIGLRTTGFDAHVILVKRGPWPSREAPGLEAMGISTSWVRSEADIRGLGL